MPPPLSDTLNKTFGFTSFRPNQEPVCRAAVEGRDVLLVMPTGSGKSLCYQLPGLARQGTTLVISVPHGSSLPQLYKHFRYFLFQLSFTIHYPVK